MKPTYTNDKKTIVIMGANRGIGKCCAEAALAAGYAVTAIVRTPSKMTLCHPRLNVVKGDALLIHTFERHIAGAYAVISALGAPADEMSKSSPPITLYSSGNRNILSAMEKYSVKRVFAISAAAVEISPANSFVVRLITKFIVQRLYGRSYENQLVMEAMFKASMANWTVVRPPKLTNKPATGKYRYTVNTFLKSCLSVSLADVAEFIIAHMEDTATYQSIVEIAY